MKLRDLILSIFISILMVTTSIAQCGGGPTVIIEPAPSDATVTCAYNDGRYEIEVDLNNTQDKVVTITVRANTTHDIKKIRIITEGGEFAWLYVHGATEFLPAGPIGTIYQEGDGDITLFRLRSTGPLGEGIGSGEPAIRIDRISEIFIEGDVLAPIEVSEERLESATIGGDLLGDVIVPNGWIKSLVVGGSIGSPGSPVNIWTMYDLNTLKCQDLYANIDTTLYDFSAGIFTLRVESADSSRGNFDGSIRTGFVHDFLDDNDGAFIITGDVLGEINVDRPVIEDITFGTFSADEPFFIGNNLDSECLARFTDPLGLKGQVIINGHNGTYGWDGVVEYFKDGSFIPLAPVPYYNNKSVDFGGGAMGRVPYYLHYADSQPTGTKVNEGSDGHENGLGECEEGYHALKKVHPAWSLPKVTLRHYGPILQEGTGKPFTVKRKTIYTLACDAGGNPNWADVTANFTHSFPAGEDRAIEINGSFDPGYDYLIEPKVDENGPDYLYCGGLDSSVGMVPIKDYDYRLRVIVAPDITGNGLLQADDITAWVLDPQDANLDGTTDNNDLVDVINAVVEYGE